MIEDDEREKKSSELGLNWWVRYAIVPVAVALIAGYSAVRAADLLKPESPGPPAASAVATPTESETPAPAGISTPAASLTPQPTGTPTSTGTPTFTLTAPPPPAEAPAGLPATGGIGRHVVRSGEHLYCIGRAYGVPPQAIAQANGLDQFALLRPEQTLVIPAVLWRTIPAGPICAPQFDSPFASPIVVDYPTAEVATEPAEKTETPTPTEITPTMESETDIPTPVETAPPDEGKFETPTPVETAPPEVGKTDIPPTTDTPEPDGTPYEP